MDHSFAANLGAYETWEFAMQDTPQAASCVDCGTTGGSDNAARTRGLCSCCYQQHRAKGTLDQFPRLTREQCSAIQRLAHPPLPTSPDPLPNRLTLARPRYVLPWGAPHQPEWQACAAWERQDTADRWPTCQPCERRGVA